jgi:hypothetical protein
MSIRLVFSFILIAMVFPLSIPCDDSLAPTRAEQWQNLPVTEQKAFIAGLIHGFDGAKYFLYLSGRVALTNPTRHLSTRDALQFAEVSFLMPESGRDYSPADAYSYLVEAINQKYKDPLYAEQSLDVVLRAIIQDTVRDRLKD